MVEAMHNLGLIKEDLNTQKTKADFPAETLAISELQFNYYRKKLLETINALIAERRRLRSKYLKAHESSDVKEHQNKHAVGGDEEPVRQKFQPLAKSHSEFQLKKSLLIEASQKKIREKFDEI